MAEEQTWITIAVQLLPKGWGHYYDEAEVETFSAVVLQQALDVHMRRIVLLTDDGEEIATIKRPQLERVMWGIFTPNAILGGQDADE